MPRKSPPADAGIRLVRSQTEHEMAHPVLYAPPIEEQMASERRRQISQGHTPERDDAHKFPDMLAAACSHIAAATHTPGHTPGTQRGLKIAREIWPFIGGFTPSTNARQELLRAGAMLIAAIEWLDRNDTTTGNRKAI